ncbi:uncharacterized protein LOC135216437 [Macrobrachium nipponense]|uniref:uncharacterized protein LOC135216437 n=1 Tax=Macrobrachium nipponense TaxID=159736 RepID=UPI0030C85D34
MVNLPGHGFTEGGLSLMPLPVTFSSGTTDRVYKQVHGKSNSSLNKVILLFGDDVPCKTSLKDAFVNYIYQTQVSDHYRLALIDDNVLGVDPRIKAYIFNVAEETLLPFNLILIDVPALGGLHSAEADIRTLMNLERFLQDEFKSTSVSAVNLVAPSSSVFFRPFINTYNLLNLSFEKLETLAQILVTNSPTHMPFVSSLRKVKISYNNLFTFYTEGQRSDEDDQFLSQIFLHYDYPGVDDFFQELKSIPPSNMSLVRKVDAGYVNPADIARLRVVNQFSETRGHRFGFGFRQLYMKETFKDEANRTRVLSIGKDNDNPNKVILIVGNKLSGKTTVATAVANHIFGVKFQDSFRLLIDDDLVSRFGKEDNLKETTRTTAYCFNHIQGLRLTYNLQIIDSAGFDCDDVQFNKTVVSKVANLLKQLCKTDSTTMLVFTAPGMQDNLPGSFKTIHKQLLRHTGIGTDKMFFLDAYAPTLRSPVPKALKKLESSKIKVFKFDSRTCFPREKEPNHKEKYKEIINDMNWEIEHQTLEKFFGKLKL